MQNDPALLWLLACLGPSWNNQVKQLQQPEVSLLTHAGEGPAKDTQANVSFQLSSEFQFKARQVGKYIC